MTDLVFEVTGIDAPVAADLVEGLQLEYVERYGTRDLHTSDPADFVAPQGVFLVVRADGEPVAAGGVRLITPELAELKRMYVAPAARRRGIARSLLHRLEVEARRLGATQLRLETGAPLHEAIALYESEGYVETEPFGPYADVPLMRHLIRSIDAATTT